MTRRYQWHSGKIYGLEQKHSGLLRAAARKINVFNLFLFSVSEKSIQFEEEIYDDQSKDIEEIIYRAETDLKEKTALPSSDTLTEPIDLVRNKSNASLKTEKGKCLTSL